MCEMIYTPWSMHILTATEMHHTGAACWIESRVIQRNPCNGNPYGWMKLISLRVGLIHPMSLLYGPCTIWSMIESRGIQRSPCNWNPEGWMKQLRSRVELIHPYMALLHGPCTLNYGPWPMHIMDLHGYYGTTPWSIYGPCTLWPMHIMAHAHYGLHGYMW